MSYELDPTKRAGEPILTPNIFWAGKEMVKKMADRPLSEKFSVIQDVAQRLAILQAKAQAGQQPVAKTAVPAPASRMSKPLPPIPQKPESKPQRAPAPASRVAKPLPPIPQKPESKPQRAPAPASRVAKPLPPIPQKPESKPQRAPAPASKQPPPKPGKLAPAPSSVAAKPLPQMQQKPKFLPLKEQENLNKKAGKVLDRLTGEIEKRRNNLKGNLKSEKREPYEKAVKKINKQIQIDSEFKEMHKVIYGFELPEHDQRRMDGQIKKLESERDEILATADETGLEEILGLEELQQRVGNIVKKDTASLSDWDLEDYKKVVEQAREYRIKIK